MYEITFLYDDEWLAGPAIDCEIFEGDYTELQERIAKLRASGCYNISACCISGD